MHQIQQKPAEHHMEMLLKRVQVQDKEVILNHFKKLCKYLICYKTVIQMIL